MSSHQQYSPVSHIDETFRPGSDRTLNDSRESIELKNVQDPGETAAPLDPLPHVFNSNKQTRKLFLPQFNRWLGTVGFVSLILRTLIVFENKGNFSLHWKYLFDTIITSLSLGLGLNFFVSLAPRSGRLSHRLTAFCLGSVQRNS